MPPNSSSDPTGIAYLKTFQAIYQLAELVMGMLVWCLLASGPYGKYGPVHFALGVFVTVWVVTLLFFITYITGLHIRINNYFASRTSPNNDAESGESTSGSLAPPSGRSVPQIRWFVAEYVLYLIMGILLFIAAVCITSQLHNVKTWFAACAFGWILAIVYEVHFCLLFRNVETLWPFQWVVSCVQKCCKGGNTEAERESLVKESTVDQN